MSGRYRWGVNGQLFVAGFPVVVEMESHVTRYVELMRKTHAPASFAQVPLTLEEQAEIVALQTLEVERARGRVWSHTLEPGGAPQIVAGFERFNGEPYRVVREYRAFILGKTDGGAEVGSC